MSKSTARPCKPGSLLLLMMPSRVFVATCGQFFAAENVDSLIELRHSRRLLRQRGVHHALSGTWTMVPIYLLQGDRPNLRPRRLPVPPYPGAGWRGSKGKSRTASSGTVRDQFLARELDLSSLDALNRQFTQWVEEQYNAPEFIPDHSAFGVRFLDTLCAGSQMWFASSRPTRPTTSCSLSRRNATSAPTTRYRLQIAPL